MSDTLLDNYTFVSSNSPNNTRHGGVGLLYKTTLPLKVREYIAFNETIVVELQVGSKIIFFTVLYRSPAHTSGTPEFEKFLSNFKTFHATIKDQDPYTMFFVGDFNGHPQQWWQGGDSTPEGNSIEDQTTMLGLTQLINEPTNCHHQITHCRFNFKIPPPPRFDRKIWLYDRASVNLIRRCVMYGVYVKAL